MKTSNALLKCHLCGAVAKEQELLRVENPFDIGAAVINGCPNCHQCDEGFERVLVDAEKDAPLSGK